MNNMPKKEISSTLAINLALKESLLKTQSSVCIGLGINDPQRIFGTTADLVELYGEERIIEAPTSENALTGITLGMALNGFSVCLPAALASFVCASEMKTPIL